MFARTLRVVAYFTFVSVFYMPIMMALLFSTTSRQFEFGVAATILTLAAGLALAFTGHFTSRTFQALLLASAVAIGCCSVFRSHQELQSVSLPDKPLALITGGSKGIGLATARALRDKGFEVVVAARSAPPKALLEADFMQCDLSALRNADDFAQRFAQRHTKLDLLVLNAGIGYSCLNCTTEDGLLNIFAINHVVQARLLRLLTPTLRQSSLARVVFVASGANTLADVELVVRPMRAEHTATTVGFAYAVTKFWQIAYAKGLAQKEPSIFYSSLHPGAIATSIIANMGSVGREAASTNFFMTEKLAFIMDVLIKLCQLAVDYTWEDVSVGAERVLFAALDGRLQSGDYFANFNQINVNMHAAALNQTIIDTVFKNTEELIAY